jgi:serine/threonine-protein kinase
MPRVCPECGRKFDTEVAKCPDDGSPTFFVNQQADLIGQNIDDRFTVKELIGVGGMGAVYRAYQHSMDRDVALKVLRRDLVADEQAIKRFLREAKAASRLTNPHTITVFDFGQSKDGLFYIAMELLKGRSLTQVLEREKGPLPAHVAVSIADQVLDSLVEAHAAGVLHRDLKPDNIFVLESVGTRQFVKVLDFGIAKLQGEKATSLTAAGKAFGTPTYMSPEQAQARDVDGRSDLYSVGVVLFEMLTGRVPFEADSPLALMLLKVQKPAPSVDDLNPSVPVRLQDVVARFLSINASDRPGDAIEAKRLLAQALAYAPSSMIPMEARPPVDVPTVAVVTPDSATEAAAPEAATKVVDAIEDSPSGPGRSARTPTPAQALFPEDRRSGRILGIGTAAVAIVALVIVGALLLPGLWEVPGTDAARPPEARPDATVAIPAEVPRDSGPADPGSPMAATQPDVPAATVKESASVVPVTPPKPRVGPKPPKPPKEDGLGLKLKRPGDGSGELKLKRPGLN